jgi:hypothetical protein
LQILLAASTSARVTTARKLYAASIFLRTRIAHDQHCNALRDALDHAAEARRGL